MRIAYLDCFSGISGDMLLGAMVDAGVPVSLLQETARSLNIGAEIRATKVDRNGISATKFDVLVNGVADAPPDVSGTHAHSHEHRHDHSHDHAHAHDNHHEHGHEHSHTHDHDHAHSHDHVHRGLKEIRAIIAAAPISEKAKQLAVRTFELLGRAEAKIHNKDLEQIHFHEVGAVDAIVDIVCASVAAEHLGIDQWVASSINVGGGQVECAHGTLPVPAPATLELLKDAPVYSSGIKKELVTPTGAALLRTLVTRFSELPKMKVTGVGYGAGARSFPGTPNVVRITLGDAIEHELSAPQENIMVLEANLDDMTPQVFGYVVDRLLAAGALDAFATPVQMKKSRPGIVLTVLSRVEDAQRLAQIIFSETTTIGLRMRQELRHTLAREHVRVETEFGSARIKVARLNGAVTNFAPEFEDCRALAERNNVPLKTVIQQAARAYLDQQSDREKARLEALLESNHG